MAIIQRSIPTRDFLRAICLACLAMLWAARTCVAGGAGDLVVASAEDHVWFITKDPSTPASWRLMHHSSGMGGAYARVARTFKDRPVALAAHEDQVLVMMSPRVGGGVGRDLLGLRVVRNAAMGSYYDLPVDGWKVLASVPPDIRSGGLGLSPGGEPLLLTLPDRRTSKGVSRDVSQDVAPPLTSRLLEQRNFDWTPLELPEELLRVEDQRLVPSPAEARASILAANGAGGARLHSLLAGEWTQRDLGIRAEEVVGVTPLGQRLAFLTFEGAGGLSVHIERGDTLLPITTLAVPEGRWGFASIGDVLLLIEVDAEHAVRVRTIDPIAGSVSDAEEWLRPPLDVSDWLHLPIIGMIVVTALLVIVLFRPSEMPDFPLRAGVRPLPLPRRLLALLIDFVPGTLIVLMVFDLDPAGLSSIPLWSSELAFAGPGLVAVGVTLLHETVSELIWGKSIGKRLVGGEVRSSNGEAPSSGAILLRALFKGVVFYAPILAIFVLFSPALQGVPETVSRTVVADTRTKENPAETE